MPPVTPFGHRIVWAPLASFAAGWFAELDGKADDGLAFPISCEDMIDNPKTYNCNHACPGRTEIGQAHPGALEAAKTASERVHRSRHGNA